MKVVDCTGKTINENLPCKKGFTESANMGIVRKFNFKKNRYEVFLEDNDGC